MQEFNFAELQEFNFAELGNVDLIVDAVYEGGRKGNAGDDPLHKLLGVSNQGGFRYLGKREELKLLVLSSSFNDLDWPDNLDKESGVLTYFGDNKKPGKELHKTPRSGNLILKNIFNSIHELPANRKFVPPILVFGNTGNYRDMRFLGLAVPGSSELQTYEDLIAIWKTSKGMRFQNYVSNFTILDLPLVSRKWICDIKNGYPLSKNCPKVWRQWVDKGKYSALKSSPTIKYRKRNEQIPQLKSEKQIIHRIHEYFSNNPYEFEPCAAKIAQIGLKNITRIDLTRHYRDGGRDALGEYRIGDEDSGVSVSFSLEAKCYGLNNPVGVKSVSRLISRIRHRQFGILVTTSYLGEQAYKEIGEDQHPIVVIAAVDIVRILKKSGISTLEQVSDWLKTKFPIDL